MSEAERPDIILFDPFSAKVDTALWESGIFVKLREAAGSHPCQLFTYSNSSLFRARLLAAGWFVARGASTGPKSETTIAANTRVFSRDWLDSTWLDRWQRSGVRTPEVALELDASVFAHEQFTR
jgi:queuine tRNA-ribosyltransferase